MFGDKIEDVLAETAKQALEAPAKEVDAQLASLINLIFTPLQLAHIHRDAWIEDYKRRIYSKYQCIPAKQIQEPPLNIIGPAIEASKYIWLRQICERCLPIWLLMHVINEWSQQYILHLSTYWPKYHP